MKLLFIAIVFITTVSYSFHLQASSLVTHKSQFFHDKTVSMVKKFLKKKKLKIFKVIDHHKGAKKAKLNLDKTSLIIFGNPKVGTLLMQENQLVGLDLPLKILVHTSNNETKVTYKKVSLIKNEYKISSKLDSQFTRIDKIFERTAEYVTSEESPKKKGKKRKSKEGKDSEIKSYDI